MSDATGELAADFASRITAPARVSASWAVYFGFARKATERGPALPSAATESTTAAGSPRSPQPNPTASSPRVPRTALPLPFKGGALSGLRGRLRRRRGGAGGRRRGGGL